MPRRRELRVDPAVLDDSDSRIAEVAEGEFPIHPEIFGRHYDAVVDALEALLPVQRTILEGLFWERLSHRKLAKRLGVDESTVRWHKKQAFLLLEEALKGVLDREDGN